MDADASVNNVSQTLWFQVLWCWQDPPCWTPAYHPLPRKKESLYYISGLHLDLKSSAFLEIIDKRLEFLEMSVESIMFLKMKAGSLEFLEMEVETFCKSGLGAWSF